MAPADAHALPFMTVDDFLAWDGDGHQGKLELVDGIVRAMAPASANHAVIQNHLRQTGSSCRAGTDAPIIPPLGKRMNARAPDVSVTCMPPSDSGVFDDPIHIVEVLSPSNEAATWETSRALGLLTSLKEILVVESTKVEALVFRRTEPGDWPMTPETVAPGTTIKLASIAAELSIDDIYRGVDL